MAEVKLASGGNYEVGLYRDIWLNVCEDDHDSNRVIDLTPAEARALVAALLSAADTAEKMAAP